MDVRHIRVAHADAGQIPIVAERQWHDQFVAAVVRKGTVEVRHEGDVGHQVAADSLTASWGHAPATGRRTTMHEDGTPSQLVVVRHDVSAIRTAANACPWVGTDSSLGCLCRV